MVFAVWIQVCGAFGIAGVVLFAGVLGSRAVLVARADEGTARLGRLAHALPEVTEAGQDAIGIRGAARGATVVYLARAVTAAIGISLHAASSVATSIGRAVAIHPAIRIIGATRGTAAVRPAVACLRTVGISGAGSVAPPVVNTAIFAVVDVADTVRIPVAGTPGITMFVNRAGGARPAVSIARAGRASAHIFGLANAGQEVARTLPSAIRVPVTRLQTAAVIVAGATPVSGGTPLATIGIFGNTPRLADAVGEAAHRRDSVDGKQKIGTVRIDLQTPRNSCHQNEPPESL